MRLPADKVKEGILHPDQAVREAAVYYFAESYNPDPTIMPLVIQAIESHGFDDAFETYSFLDDLVQTEETVRWLIQQFERASREATGREAVSISWYSSALAAADASLLQQHKDEILGLEWLEDEAKYAITECITFLSRPSTELWRDLEAFCDLQDDEDSLSDEDFAHACRLIAALGRSPDPFVEPVLAILRGDTDDYDNWNVVFAVRLAGEMKLEAAVPLLIDLLYDADDWLYEECHRALVKISTDTVVTQLAGEAFDADSGLGLDAALILMDLRSDPSVQTCLDLLHNEQEHEVQCLLLQAILLNFATEGIEPARQFLLGTSLDPDVLEVRTALLTACKLMGERFPEFDAWLEDSKNDEEFRLNWHEEHPLPPDEDEEEWDEDFEEDAEAEDWDEGFEDEIEAPLPPPKPFVRTDARVGRNDPCPCGSGKKYKKCCYGKGPIEDASASDLAAGMGSLRYIPSPPKYPAGTVAFYGPDDKTTTKIAAGVIRHEGAQPIIERWVGTKIKDSFKVQRQMQEFFKKHGVKSVAMAEGNMGCPHEEGEDFPIGEDCPFCPFWKGKQGSARRE